MRNPAEYNRRYRQRHPERARAGSKAWRKRNREYMNTVHREWVAANRLRAYEIRLRERRKLKLRILTHYSITNPPSCAFCGYTTIEALCLDHINNDGATHRREVFGSQSGKGGYGHYQWIARNNYPAIYQVLCANCNLIKATRFLEATQRQRYSALADCLQDWEIKDILRGGNRCVPSATSESPPPIKPRKASASINKQLGLPLPASPEDGRSLS